MPSHSLRKKLLLWLLVPLLVLIAIDSTILYRIAMHFQHKAFDHALADSALDIAELVHESNESTQRFQLRPEVRQAILSDQFDQMYYSIIDEKGSIVGGDSDLHFVARPRRQDNKPYFSYTNIRGNLARVATSYVSVNTASGVRPVYIQVAETLNKRNRLASQILIGIVVPQLILVLAAVSLLWFGTRRGLQPLWELHSSLARRSHRDLSPVLLPDIPDEVKMLVDSVNLFMLQLKNVLESQNRFIADAAHQLRTPLAGMQAQLELAQQEKDPLELQASLARIARSLERLSHLVNQLLMLARNQSEVMRTLDMQTLDLSRLAQEVSMEMVPAALQKSVDLGFECADDLLLIKGDIRRLKEMLYNLIDNAIRYSEVGAKITVRTFLDEHSVVLSVMDNGPGIPVDERERVFERFHRVIGSEQEGSGLGLAIVMEIAHIHQAKVILEDGEGGEGVLVSVVFKAVEPEIANELLSLDADEI
ncbi:MAG: sensor histidine kinase [Candidatus Methylopumilus sp.]|jgi:two-component system sensor histidine kinase TctE